MNSLLKQMHKKLTQILIYNHLEIGRIFSKIACNLLIIIIFAFARLDVKHYQLSFFFFFINQFKASQTI